MRAPDTLGSADAGIVHRDVQRRNRRLMHPIGTIMPAFALDENYRSAALQGCPCGRQQA